MNIVTKITKSPPRRLIAAVSLNSYSILRIAVGSNGNGNSHSHRNRNRNGPHRFFARTTFRSITNKTPESSLSPSPFLFLASCLASASTSPSRPFSSSSSSSSSSPSLDASASTISKIRERNDHNINIIGITGITTVIIPTPTPTRIPVAMTITSGNKTVPIPVPKGEAEAKAENNPTMDVNMDIDDMATIGAPVNLGEAQRQPQYEGREQEQVEQEGEEEEGQENQQVKRRKISHDHDRDSEVIQSQTQTQTQTQTFKQDVSEESENKIITKFSSESEEASAPCDLQTPPPEPSSSSTTPPTTTPLSTAAGVPSVTGRTSSTSTSTIPPFTTPTTPHRHTPTRIPYENALHLAPMVRSGALPTRLLSLKYGAGLVWSPEVVDRAIIGAMRRVDATTGVITYYKPSSHGPNAAASLSSPSTPIKPIFTCHPVEKPFLIFQLGSSTPALALSAAKVVEQDVAAFDLNCGCPKPFSTHSGMGAALLSTPDLLIEILQTLIAGTSKPVSAKIRLLPTQEQTITLVRRILETGVSALTVHCRTREMRSSSPALWHRLREIVEVGKEYGIPVICNGDGAGHANWNEIKEKTGVSSVMIARAAENNPSVFLESGPISNYEELIPKHFLPICVYTDNAWSSTRFLLSQHSPSGPPTSKLGKREKKEWQEKAGKAKTYEDVVKVWDKTVDQCRSEGEMIMRELRSKLEAREPGCYQDGHE